MFDCAPWLLAAEVVEKFNLNLPEIHLANVLLTAVSVLAGLVLVFLAIAFPIYGKLWFQAYMSSANVRLLSLVGMSFRQVNPRTDRAGQDHGGAGRPEHRPS